GSPRRRCGDRRGKQALKRPLAMSVARTLEWAKIRARSETLLARINVEARAARQQRAKIARAKAERLLEELTDEELYERFRNAGKDAREWHGLRSEFDQESGRAEALGNPVKFQVEQNSTPAARGEKVEIRNPVRSYATQFWRSPDGGGRAMISIL